MIAGGVQGEHKMWKVYKIYRWDAVVEQLSYAACCNHGVHCAFVSFPCVTKSRAPDTE